MHLRHIACIFENDIIGGIQSYSPCFWPLVEEDLTQHYHRTSFVVYTTNEQIAYFVRFCLVVSSYVIRGQVMMEC